jgi:Rad3-related DNA helicase
LRDFLKIGDGSGREMRPVQVQALEWLEKNWDAYDVFCINGPVGSGKSLIARTVQRSEGGVIVTASNVLLDQYVDEYGINFVKGREHYTSPSGLDCSEECPIVTRNKPCVGCPYRAARAKADEGVPTIFNPASLYYLHGGDIPRKVTSVDEMHTLSGFIQQLCSTSFSKNKYQWPSQAATSEIEFKNWLTELLRKSNKWVEEYNASTNKKDHKKDYKALCKSIDSWERTLKAFKESPELFALWVETKPVRGRKEEYLHVQPVLPVKSFCDSILGQGKIILMSGTIFDIDIRPLIGERKYAYLDLESPIAAEKRPIIFRPIADSVTVQTPPETIARSIEAIAGAHPGENFLVHLSYSDSTRVAACLRISFIANTKTTKQSRISEFKSGGGLFLASGCAEGINLPDDECRVIYIPRLLKPNLADMVVKKRMSLVDGQRWYDLTILKNVMQSIGRGARHENDWCKTYIGDPQFAKLVSRYYKELPKYFLDSITWA